MLLLLLFQLLLLVLLYLLGHAIALKENTQQTDVLLSVTFFLIVFKEQGARFIEFRANLGI